MQVWYFSETAYPYLPPEAEYDSIRVTLPSRHYKPDVGQSLYDRYLDEWCLADAEGLNVMVNEHHQTATCVDPAAPLMLAALSRITTKARLLILGNPIANRRDPIRVAEEMALLDLLCHGRLEVGFVRGVPYEISPANSNPVRMNERQWEALDLIVKAWTSHDGPFSHEGQFFHHRNINVWPRSVQMPHPPIWVSATSASGAARVGTRGYVNATFLTGYRGTPRVFNSYRQGWKDAGREGPPPLDRLAYSPMIYVGETTAAGREIAKKLLWYLHSNKVPDHFKNPPGYAGVDANAAIMRGGLPGHKVDSVEEAIRQGLMFAGSPDDVHDQIVRFYGEVGGFGHLLMLGQAGFLDHAEAASGIRLFAREVLPRLRETLKGHAASINS
jgi:alkanesulfonate monooxygenase SsuD/methylene tetrahydromethanopterin reductase-like flavin-dependent oxidoreductase (luciferase family)